MIISLVNTNKVDDSPHDRGRSPHDRGRSPHDRGVGREATNNYKNSNNKNLTRNIYSRSEVIKVFLKVWKDKPAALAEAHATRFYNYYKAKDFKLGSAKITDLAAVAENWTFYSQGGKKVKALRDEKFNELLEKFKNKNS